MLRGSRAACLGRAWGSTRGSFKKIATPRSPLPRPPSRRRARRGRSRRSPRGPAHPFPSTPRRDGSRPGTAAKIRPNELVFFFFWVGFFSFLFSPSKKIDSFVAIPPLTKSERENGMKRRIWLFVVWWKREWLGLKGRNVWWQIGI